MEDHGLSLNQALSIEWKLIDDIRKRKRTTLKQRNFLNLPVIREIWQSFLKSKEMTKWSLKFKEDCLDKGKYFEHF